MQYVSICTIDKGDKEIVVDTARIERLEKELEEARRELLREDGKRYRILMREISNEEKERILGNLTDKGERFIFGLEAPEPGKRGAAMRPGGWGSHVFYLRKRSFNKAGLGAAYGTVA